MPQIALLSQETIDKIAAGEVIERPSSVVKELVENAIDAGSSAVTVEIKEGGISFIRISDNGCGIEREQIPLAFLRHSTSKIKSVEDLFTVTSLGFRGEALSSIAAVSQVELITKTNGDFTGSRYLIEGSKEVSLEEIGAPDGTTFISDERRLPGLCALQTAEISEAGSRAHRQPDGLSGGGPVSPGRKRPLHGGNYKRPVCQPPSAVFTHREALCGYGFLLLLQ